MGLRKSLLLLVSLFLFSGCDNLFLPLADKTSDEALYVDAIVANDANNYTLVIEKINSMSTAYQARDDVKYLLASAYASLCGLNFLNFSEAFNGLGSTTMFEFLLEYFTDSTITEQDYCIEAEQAYDGISTNTTGDYLNRTYIAFAKIGVILNKLNNDAGAGNTNDGSLDPCAFVDVDDATHTNDVSELYTGFTRVIINIGNAGLDGDFSCTNAGSIDCSKTDSSLVNDDERLLIKNLIDSPDPGLNTGSGSDCS